MVKEKAFMVRPSSQIVAADEIYFNMACRQTAMVPFDGIVKLRKLGLAPPPARHLRIKVKPFRETTVPRQFGATQLETYFRTSVGTSIMNSGQPFFFKTLLGEVLNATVSEVNGSIGSPCFAFLQPSTKLEFFGPYVSTSVGEGEQAAGEIGETGAETGGAETAEAAKGEEEEGKAELLAKIGATVVVEGLLRVARDPRGSVITVKEFVDTLTQTLE